MSFASRVLGSLATKIPTLPISQAFGRPQNISASRARLDIWPSHLNFNHTSEAIQLEPQARFAISGEQFLPPIIVLEQEPETIRHALRLGCESAKDPIDSCKWQRVDERTLPKVGDDARGC